MRALLKEIRTLRHAVETVATMERETEKRTKGSIVGLVDAKGTLKKCVQRNVGGALHEVDNVTPDMRIPFKMGAFLEKSRYKVAFGGRGSGKTQSAAALIVDVMRYERHRILCCREVMSSIADSSYREMVDNIERRGIENEFTITEKAIRHKATKSFVVFYGLIRHISKIKSMAGITICWIDEADTVSELAWRYLKNTMRMKGSEIWITFNPRKVEDPIYDRFVETYKGSANDGDFIDDRHHIVRVNYLDNYWFPEELEDERVSDKVLNQALYEHTWLGNLYRNDKEMIKSAWWHYFESVEKTMAMCSSLFITVDSAYTSNPENDPSVYALWGTISKNKLCLLALERVFCEFPQLIIKLKNFYDRFNRTHVARPVSAVYIEAKASGLSLVQTLRDHGIRSIPWEPTRFKYPIDKVGRVNESAWSIYSGDVLIPDYDIPENKWVKAFVNECSEFTDNDEHAHDDQVDVLTMAVSIFRLRGGGTARKVARQKAQELRALRRISVDAKG